MQPILVFSTFSEKHAAKKFAQKIVKTQLAACVQMIDGATSIYHWNGKIEESSEVLLLIKTFANKLDDLKIFFKENHPYEVPEIVAVNVENVSEAYLKWMGEILK